MRVFKVDVKPCATPEPCPDPTASYLADNQLVRVLSRFRVRLEPSLEAMRRDQRNYAELRFDVASSDVQDWLLDTELTAQLFFHYQRHRFVIRPHAIAMAGAVRFWDEVPLGGDWQRVWFDNRYWVRHAAQLELGYRLNVYSDWVDVGIFHDLSVFGDRTNPGNPAAVANAFGPSLHLLLFDTFALNVHYGFGFGPPGFGHGISFGVETTF